MLFIDTWHTHDQLKEELERHHGKVSKFITMHDTETFGIEGEDKKKPGLTDALIEFLFKHKEWKIYKHYKNNNGLTILRRDK